MRNYRQEDQMKYKTIVIAAFMCCVLFASQSIAGTKRLVGPYLSAHLGAFISSRSDFASTYNSNTGLAFGVGAGLPFTSQLYLCARATYFSKSGTPWWYTYSFQNGTTTLVSKVRDGSAEFKQWIFNAGLRYNFPILTTYQLGVGAGVTVTMFSESDRSANGLGSSENSGEGALGYYGELDIQRRLRNTPLVVFGDVRYNLTRQTVLAAVGNYGGVDLSIGVRCIFQQ